MAWNESALTPLHGPVNVPLTNETSLLCYCQYILDMQQAAAVLEFPPDGRAAQAFASSTLMDFIPVTRPPLVANRLSPLTITTTASKGKSRLVKIFFNTGTTRLPKKGSNRANDMGLFNRLTRSLPVANRLSPLTITTTASRDKSRLVKIFFNTGTTRQPKTGSKRGMLMVSSYLTSSGVDDTGATSGSRACRSPATGPSLTTFLQNSELATLQVPQPKWVALGHSLFPPVHRLGDARGSLLAFRKNLRRNHFPLNCIVTA